jgi:ribonucleotide monophosphatase NagD (HAD superfamily)
VIRDLQEQGKKVFFLSNSSGRTRNQMVDKFKKLGLEVNKEQMFGSAYITAHYLSINHPEVKRVRVVGMDSICSELEFVGIESVGGENEKI